MTKVSTQFSFLTWKIIILFGVAFLNPWIWKIIRENLLIAIVLILLTLLLFKLIMARDFKIRALVAISFLFLALSFIMLKSNFDQSIQTFTPEDKVKLNDRHFYYSQDLGKLFLNNKVLNYYSNYSLPIYKVERNLFSSLDLNLYFLASAPRERGGGGEFEKYSFVLLPFFIIGILLLIYRGSILALGYLIAAILVTALVSPNYMLGPILFFPLINIFITIGIIYILNGFKKSKNEN